MAQPVFASRHANPIKSKFVTPAEFLRELEEQDRDPDKDKDKIALWGAQKADWSEPNKNDHPRPPRADGKNRAWIFPRRPYPGSNPAFDDIQEKRATLPITQQKRNIIQHVINNPVTIIGGETGCGKSTQVPQYLVEHEYAKYGRIAVTEPRRVAATSLATRVANEANVKLGEEVGYRIRFDDHTSRKTILQYMSDGSLLRECIANPRLEGYSVVIVDEAHERSVSIDILLGLLKNILAVRTEFRVIIMSATMDANKFSEYFYNAPVFHVPGRQYAVKVYHTTCEKTINVYHKPSETFLIHAIVETVHHILQQQRTGDILIFLYGEQIIEDVCQELEKTCRRDKFIILPLYRSLTFEQQNLVFVPTPPGKRKIVVSTNVAESSVTIDGVRYVIDSGFMKVSKYNSSSGIEHLEVCTISHQHAIQRAGRAGRTQDGVCYRMYTLGYFRKQMKKSNPPELLRTNLAGSLLYIKATGVHDLLEFDFIDPPKLEHMIDAHVELLNIKAIDTDGHLTKLGQKLAQLPLEPELAKLVFTGSHNRCCGAEIAAVAAMLSGQPVFMRPNSQKVYMAHLDVDLNPEDERDVRDTLFDVVHQTVQAVCADDINYYPSVPAPFQRPEGDLVSMLLAWRQFYANEFSKEWCVANGINYRSMVQAKDVFKQLTKIMDKERIPINSCGDDMVSVQRTVADVMYLNIAARTLDHEGRPAFHPLGRRYAYPLDTSSGLYDSDPDYVIYYKLRRRGRTFMSCVTAVNPEFFEFALPPTDSENVEEDYRTFSEAQRKKNEARQLTRYIIDTYRPRTYGTPYEEEQNREQDAF
ncbi:hypothetical protein QR680_011563 [Steinernema hermaphroditum]|uniref:RNA helicase n=1 Tax=Steinernema hermaphroditum TaxID=289476 RepID=A0AA39LYW2_9BILA|nr:hypothetical protein QR680_011563 [Steinernema hermaphroditum]